ncbi:MAG: hypothetical protein QM589_14300 [Thermomicrobiales bacterium]
MDRAPGQRESDPRSGSTILAVTAASPTIHLFLTSISPNSRRGQPSQWLLSLLNVHSVDGHSNKIALMPPGIDELSKLAEQSRTHHPVPTPVESNRVPPRSLRRRLSPEVIEEMVARYRAGEETPALSLEYGISKTGLRQMLLAEGVRFRKHRITPEDAEKAVLLYERGMTITQVVERLGYSYGTIRAALHDNGVAMRVSGQRRKSGP